MVQLRLSNVIPGENTLKDLLKNDVTFPMLCMHLFIYLYLHFNCVLQKLCQVLWFLYKTKSLILSCHSKSYVLSKRLKEHNHTVESMVNIIRGHYFQGQTSNSYFEVKTRALGFVIKKT